MERSKLSQKRSCKDSSKSNKRSAQDGFTYVSKSDENPGCSSSQQMAVSPEEPCCSRSLDDSNHDILQDQRNNTIENANKDDLDITCDGSLTNKSEEASAFDDAEEVQQVAYFRLPLSGRVNFYDYPENPFNKYGPSPGVINIINEYEEVLSILSYVLPPQMMTPNNIYKKARRQILMTNLLKENRLLRQGSKQLYKIALLKNSTKMLRREERAALLAPPEVLTEEQHREQQLVWTQVQNYYYQAAMWLRTGLPFSIIRECHDIHHPPFFHISYYILQENTIQAYRTARQYVIDTALEKFFENVTVKHKEAQMKKKGMKKGVSLRKQFLLKNLIMKLDQEAHLETLQDAERSGNE